MIPYFIFSKNVNEALFVSIGITAVVLLAFGFTKARLSGTGLKECCIGAVQTLLLGGSAAGAAYGIVYGVNSVSVL
jgi:VIT1/CCC1 family predicted Fe2+/Mn2+ transporter